eukprot:TRINITY_DN87396_c0_g1_i1.p1 TRINITY_DN87396_c0_g1~~TRINITY_DN87396_c0_g1_i1.p1  ORF type:complete len:107 (+),score=11.49 TRINITY_DN87396_c0_g1_i1:206-526(+)
MEQQWRRLCYQNASSCGSRLHCLGFSPLTVLQSGEVLLGGMQELAPAYIVRGCAMKTYVGQSQHLVVDSAFRWKPMQLTQDRSDLISPSQPGHNTGCRVLDHLQAM